MQIAGKFGSKQISQLMKSFVQSSVSYVKHFLMDQLVNITPSMNHNNIPLEIPCIVKNLSNNNCQLAIMVIIPMLVTVVKDREDLCCLQDFECSCSFYYEGYFYTFCQNRIHQ